MKNHLTFEMHFYILLLPGHIYTFNHLTYDREEIITRGALYGRRSI